MNGQQPVTIDDGEPEPDVSVVRGSRQQYRKRHPGPADIGLLVEVSDTTLQQDRTWKKRIYAEAKVPVYWIVNLPEEKVEVYTNPTGACEQPDYLQRQDFSASDLVPLVIDGNAIAQIPVRDLLP